jgi:hypothetical protein
VIKTHCGGRAQNLLERLSREHYEICRRAAISLPFQNVSVRPKPAAPAHCAPQASLLGGPLEESPEQHQGLFDSNRSMICFFSFDDTLGGGTAGGVIPAGPTPPIASLAPAVGFAESRPMLATKPLPGVMSV